MKGKSQTINNQIEPTETEELKQKDIKFRTCCKDCNFNGKCLLEANSRMIKKKCYIDTMAKKLKIKPQTVIARCNTVLEKCGMWDFSFIKTIDKDYWLGMSNNQRLTDIRYNLNYYAERENTTITNEDIKIFFAVANCYFSAWRDEEYIPCACCGQIIKNSKQRNRKYCDKCKDKHKIFSEEKIKTCIDCGCKFDAWHNREIRCIDCQINANKASARERTKRCREKSVTV